MQRKKCRKGKKPKPFPLTEGLRKLFETVPPDLTSRVFVNPKKGKGESPII
jgi:hypothetical protein